MYSQFSEAEMHLARFPRVRLFPTPTPLEPLDNFSRALGGPRIWLKRDDCTVVATGGNKVRKLEFLAGEAVAPCNPTMSARPPPSPAAWA